MKKIIIGIFLLYSAIFACEDSVDINSGNVHEYVFKTRDSIYSVSRQYDKYNLSVSKDGVFKRNIITYQGLNDVLAYVLSRGAVAVKLYPINKDKSEVKNEQKN